MKNACLIVLVTGLMGLMGCGQSPDSGPSNDVKKEEVHPSSAPATTGTRAGTQSTAREPTQATAPNSAPAGEETPTTATTDRPTKLPDGQIQHLTGHVGAIAAVSFLANDQQAISAGCDGTVRVWDLTTEGQTKSLDVLPKAAGGLHFALAPDDSRFISARMTLAGPTGGPVTLYSQGRPERINRPAKTAKGTFAWWNLAEGKVERNYELPTSEGQYWEKKQGQQTMKTHRVHEQVWGIAYAPDGAHALVSQSDGLCLWDLESGSKRQLMTMTSLLSDQLENKVTGHVPIGTKTGGRGGPSHESTLLPGQAAFSQVRFSPSGKLAVYFRGVWNTDTWNVVALVKEAFGAAVFAPNERQLLVARGQELQLLDLPAGTVSSSWYGHAAGINSLAVSRDGRLALSGDEKGQLILWKTTAGLESRRFTGHQGAVTCVAFSNDGQRAISGGQDGCVRVWDLMDPAETRQPGRVVQTHDKFINSSNSSHENASEQAGSIAGVAFAPDGRHVLTYNIIDAGGVFETGVLIPVIRFWDLATHLGVREIRLSPGRVRNDPNWVCSMAVSPDGRRAAVGRTRGDISILNLIEGGEDRRLVGDTGPITSVAFSPDGRHLLSAGMYEQGQGQGYEGGNLSQSVRLWSLDTGKELRMLGSLAKVVNCVAFAPTGDRVASGGQDSNVVVWNVASGEESCRFSLDGTAIVRIAFSANAQRLAALGSDGTLVLFDLEATREVRRLAVTESPIPETHYSPQLARGWKGTFGYPGSNVLFSQSGQNLIASHAGEAVLCDTENGGDILQFRLAQSTAGFATGGNIPAIAFSPDTRFAVVAPVKGGLNVTALGDADFPQAKEASPVYAVRHTSACLRKLTSYPADWIGFSADGQAAGVYWQSSSAGGRLPEAWPSVRARRPGRASPRPSGGRLPGARASGIDIWRLSDRTKLAALPVSEIHDAIFFPNGSKILVASQQSNEVELWDISTQKVIGKLHGSSGSLAASVRALAFDADGREAVAIHGPEAKWLCRWELSELTKGSPPKGRRRVARPRKGRKNADPRPFEDDPVWLRRLNAPESTMAANYKAVALDRTGRHALFLHRTGGLECWDVKKARMLWSSPSSNEQTVENVALSNDGHRSVVITSGAGVSLWDVQSGNMSQSFEVLPSGATCAAFPLQDDLVLFGAPDGSLALWDIERSQRLLRMDAHEGPVARLAVSPDGRFALSSAADGCYLWDLATLVHSVRPQGAEGTKKATRDERPAPEYRQWTDLTGKHRIQAVCVRVEDGIVTLRKSSGETIKIPIEKLSEADQSRVKQQMPQEEKPQKP